ncbi:uncharacterized protein MKZ38_004058 [Zalerion maritima]|uniref:Asteroid domain-containing protein n=1 Tax=Zalerion maritima TaxID=339359 RepID=A0AAD5RMU7_9PEZI|nr:uncharacterized protein MKZ38_004058 [Zalerion maritima]
MSAMGIRHLTPALRPSASDSQLDGQTVVVDGPSMVYHVFNIWSQKNPHHTFSYTGLGEATDKWLDRLGRKVTLAKIYFDAYLPPSKQPVRIERMAKESATWSSYYWANSTRMPPPTSPRVPWPSFLVPATIEHLFSLPQYAALIELVPGEADGYCAAFASGDCTIITSDSDLLVHHPLDDATRVVFLRDIGDASVKTVKNFYPGRIAERLGILEQGGICRLAYEMSQNSKATLRQHLHRIKNGTAPKSHSDYATFQNQYRVLDLNKPTKFPPDILERLYLLDPRVSEFLLSCTLGDGDRVSMYLPFIPDCPVRTSAWKSSENVRGLTYGLAADAFDTGKKIVVEYRRLQSTSSHGRLLDILPPENVAGELLRILKALSLQTSLLSAAPGAGAATEIDGRPYIWDLFCVYSDYASAISMDQTPISYTLLNKAAITSADPVDASSWDLVHFAAQCQAVYYSLRMVKQILTILSETGHETPGLCRELMLFLQDLPPLKHMASPAELAGSMSKWNGQDVLSSMSALFGPQDFSNVEDIANRDPKSERMVKQKKKKKNKQKPQSSAPANSLMGNPFAALAQ